MSFLKIKTHKQIHYYLDPWFRPSTGGNTDLEIEAEMPNKQGVGSYALSFFSLFRMYACMYVCIACV